MSTPPPKVRRPRLRRALLLLPSVAVAWVVAGFVTSRLALLSTEPFTVYNVFSVGLLTALMAPLTAWIEARDPNREVRRSGAGWLVLGRALLYGLIATSVLIVMSPLRELLFGVLPLGDVWRELQRLPTERLFWRVATYLTLASFAVSFWIHLRLIVGRQNLWPLFAGTYRNPVEEERLFVFIDLIDSTGTAERLGALAFTHFKHEFFSEFTLPLQGSGGAIVQYVGDEVMLTWPLGRARLRGVLPFVAGVRRRIANKTQHYRDTYGAVPAFRTGIHAGQVVVAEVGDLHRDIVYSGDVVNATARLLAACREHDAALLISASALERVVVPEGWRARAVGALELRGRTGGLEAFAMEVG